MASIQTYKAIKYKNIGRFFEMFYKIPLINIGVVMSNPILVKECCLITLFLINFTLYPLYLLQIAHILAFHENVIEMGYLTHIHIIACFYTMVVCPIVSLNRLIDREYIQKLNQTHTHTHTHCFFCFRLSFLPKLISVFCCMCFAK